MKKGADNPSSTYFSSMVNWVYESITPYQKQLNYYCSNLNDENYAKLKVLIRTVPLAELDFNKISENKVDTLLVRLFYEAFTYESKDALEVIIYLLENASITQLDFNARQGDILSVYGKGRTVLYLATQAALAGEYRLLQLIFQKDDLSKLDFNAKPEYKGATVLHNIVTLAIKGHPEYLEAVFDKVDIARLNVFAKDNNGIDVVTKTAQVAKDYPKALEMMLQKVDFSKYDFTHACFSNTVFNSVVEAAKNGHPKALESMLDIFDPLQFDDKSISHLLDDAAFIAKQGHPRLLEMLLQKPLKRPESSFMLIFKNTIKAACAGHTKALELLMGNDCSLDRLLFDLSKEKDLLLDEALKGNSLPLEIVLEHVRVMECDFHFRRNFVCKIAELAAKGNVRPLEILLGKFKPLNARKLNMLINGDISLFWCITVAAYTGHPELLNKIVKDVDNLHELNLGISVDGFSMRWLIVVLAIDGQPEALKAIQKSFSVRNIPQDLFKLEHDLSDLDNDSISEYLLNAVMTGKIPYHAKKEAVLSCLVTGRTKLAIALMELGFAPKRKEIGLSLKDAAEAGHFKGVKAFLQHQKLVDIPIFDIIFNKNFFYSPEHLQDFFASSDPIGYLEFHQACLPSQVAALRLLHSIKIVSKLEEKSQNNKENAMSDKPVLVANRHFEEKVKPHFQQTFLSFSATQDVNECILAIEKMIRKLILDKHLENAKEKLKIETIKFIQENYEDLINAQDKAMSASTSFFSGDFPEEAAWRGYNRFASVTGIWPNLLTQPSEKRASKTVFSTSASHEGQLSLKEASNIVRERVCYYALAVLDESQGNDLATRAEGIMCFISELAEIRNTHKKDDPSCFPGHITRIAKMGAFHSIARLPNTLLDYFAETVTSQFNEKVNSLAMLEEKEALYFALINLTAQTAKDIIYHPQTYPQIWLSLRQQFIDAMGTPQEIFNKIKDEGKIVLEDKDIYYITQFLLDIAQGKISTAITDCYFKAIDSVPTMEEMKAANPFSEQDKAYAVCDVILKTLLDNLSVYRKSKLKLDGLRDLLAVRVPLMLTGKEVNQILADGILKELEGESQNKQVALELILNKLLCLIMKNQKTKIVSPFETQIKSLTSSHLPQELLKGRLSKLEEKHSMFISFYELVQEVFEDASKEKEFIPHLTEQVVNFCYDNPGHFDLDLFASEVISALDEDDKCTLIEMDNFENLLKVLAGNIIQNRGSEGLHCSSQLLTQFAHKRKLEEPLQEIVESKDKGKEKVDVDDVTEMNDDDYEQRETKRKRYQQG